MEDSLACWKNVSYKLQGKAFSAHTKGPENCCHIKVGEEGAMEEKRKGSKKRRQAKGITNISIKNYKSIENEQSIDVTPLTILAGANSSGKSSLFQPILLLKQTIDAPYDPGSLLIDGPNVKFTSSEQFFPKRPGIKATNRFSAGFVLGNRNIIINFKRFARRGVDVESVNMTMNDGKSVIIDSNSTGEDVKSLWVEGLEDLFSEYKLVARKNRCFYDFIGSDEHFTFDLLGAAYIYKYFSNIIHIPGLRGNPVRNYKVTGLSDEFAGTFDNYVASVLYHWYTTNSKKLMLLNSYMEILGLTWKVMPKRLDETQIEIKVGRLIKSRRGGAQDLVNIADVGFGLSQSLPVIVALLIAEPGQLVIVEQPEIHLHPNAQLQLAKILVETAKRGVRLVVETHSSILIRGIQTLVAKGVVDGGIVKLHWFSRDECSGLTQISSTSLEADGSFGDWPEDFDSTYLESEMNYLDAVEARMFVHG